MPSIAVSYTHLDVYKRQEPVSAAEFRAELKKIDQEKPKAATLYLGSVVTALSFTLFFGGTWYDSLLAALVGAMIRFLQPVSYTHLVFTRDAERAAEAFGK